jgi:uncharacterized DUF497 family protein
MIDLRKLLGFDWDDGNIHKSVDKHHVSPGEAEQVFSNEPLLLLHDAAHSEIELRFHAYGRTDAGRHLQISFTLRRDSTFVRVISVRPMSAKERARYDQEA